MQQRAPIQVRFVKIKLSVFVPAWGNGTGREHEIFCVSAETEHITWILLMLHADKSLSFRLVSKCLICDYNDYFQNNILSLNFIMRHTRQTSVNQINQFLCKLRWLDWIFSEGIPPKFEH